MRGGHRGPPPGGHRGGPGSFHRPPPPMHRGRRHYRRGGCLGCIMPILACVAIATLLIASLLLIA